MGRCAACAREARVREGVAEVKGRRCIRTLDSNVDVILLITGFCFPTVVVGLRERIEGLEILDVRGHEIDWSALLVLREVVLCG